MSVVTDVILTCALGEEADGPDYFSCPAVEKINEWLVKERYGMLRRVDDEAGGNKVMQAVVYLGAFNYLDVDCFIKQLKEAPWELPESVRVFIKREQEEFFSQVVWA